MKGVVQLCVCRTVWLCMTKSCGCSHPDLGRTRACLEFIHYDTISEVFPSHLYPAGCQTCPHRLTRFRKPVLSRSLVYDVPRTGEDRLGVECWGLCLVERPRLWDKLSIPRKSFPDMYAYKLSRSHLSTQPSPCRVSRTFWRCLCPLGGLCVGCYLLCQR